MVYHIRASGQDLAGRFKRAAAGATFAALTLVGGQAMASGDVQIDNGANGGWRPAPAFCTLGVACSGITLGFNIDVGHGLTNKVYTYTNGLTSIGHELVVPAVGLDGDGVLIPNYNFSLGDFAGQDFFTPYFGPSGSAFQNIRTLPGLDIIVDGAVYNGGFGTLQTYIEFILSPVVGTHQGAFSLAFNTGPNHNSPIYPPYYEIGGQTLTDPHFSFRTFDLGSTPLDTGGGVPEPAAWALMIAGLGGVGAALRSRRRVLATG